jgi:hypothetical protein
VRGAEAGGLRIQVHDMGPAESHADSDAYCSPGLARALYESKPGDKEILWLDAGQHIDLYDQSPHVSQAAEAAAGFLHRKLARPGNGNPPLWVPRVDRGGEAPGGDVVHVAGDTHLR